MIKGKNIALLGGSFDPVHWGHIDIAHFLLASQQIQIDEVWLTPDYTPLLDKTISNHKHRLQMLHLAAQNLDNIKVFDYKIKYRVEGGAYVLLTLLPKEPSCKEHNFYYVIGQDCLEQFNKWDRFEDLAKLTTFIIVPRSGYENLNYHGTLQDKPHLWLQPSLNHPIRNISSTIIREKIKDQPSSLTNSSWNKWLCRPVIKYIQTHNLYLK